MRNLFMLVVVIIVQMQLSFAWGDSMVLPHYYFHKGNEWIRVGGSWVGDSPESSDPYFKDFALQTSELACMRVQAICFEARAVKKGAVLLSYLLEYKVERWDTERVIAVLDGAAAIIRIIFDKQRDTVSLVHTEKSGKKLDRAHLADGIEAVGRAEAK